MRLALIALVAVAFSSAGLGAESISALEALKLLPPEKAGSLARIEGREGAPGPERWHLIVYDPTQENAVQEFVVAGNKIVATRSLSQFADTLKPEDVIGSGNIKVDSNQAFRVVQAYARTNIVNVGSMNYQLTKQDAQSAPVWKIKCISEKGQNVGLIVVAADDGRVISHEGFKSDPNAGGSALALQKNVPEQSKSKTLPRRQRQQNIPVTTPAGPPPDPVAERFHRFGDKFRNLFAPADPQQTPRPQNRPH